MLLAACGGNQSKKQAGNVAQTVVSDKDITDAYAYLLGRELVLKQQRLDFEKEGFRWNIVKHRTPGGVDWANPNLDVAYSEAWVAVDENTCVLLEIPKITGRYYTWHMLNGWGETVLNINERTYPQQPFGKYALCLKGGNPQIPEGALRVDLPCKTSRVLARVELGKNPKEAVALQQQIKLKAQGTPKIDEFIKVPVFEGMNFPGADMFENASAKLVSEADINVGMDSLQIKVKAVEALVKSGAEGKVRVEKVIKETAIPAVMEKVHHIGTPGNGWLHPLIVGNYGGDYLMRTATNIAGIWANNQKEATYYANPRLDGEATYVLTFPKDQLPAAKSKYFWSIIAVDSEKFQVLPNPLKRYLLNNQSPLKYNADGSLTLVFSPEKQTEYPESNRLPTVAGTKYGLTFRYYGASDDISSGQYFPPQLVKQ